MSNWIQAHGRMLKSARILKAFYESKLQMDVELLTEAPVPPLANDVGFVSSVTGYGLWGLRPSKPISEEMRNEISTTCESILGGLEDLDIRRESLERMQQQMERSLNGEMPSNVLPFQQRRPSFRSGKIPGAEKVYMLKQDCLIESPSVMDVHKMAMEIHASSSRSAFVEYFQLDASERMTISQLMSLGAITLFVPNICALSMYEQEMFRHLMKQPVQFRPLLMVGSSIPYSELRQQPGVDDEFLTLLARAYIKLTKSFSEYKDQGLIHYFLDTLSSDPT